MNNRVRLFSQQPARRKLFSDEGIQEKEVVCQDCGYKFRTTANTTNFVCPKCGGDRFNVSLDFYSPEGTPEPVPEKTFSTRKSLFGTEEDFQKEFSGTDSPLELKLKKFSGKSIEREVFEKEFSDYTSAEELEERGFAEISDNRVNISKDAFFQARLFSKLTMTITKTLELDPAVMCAGDNEKCNVINSLESKGDLNPKCIMILRKIHDIPGGGDSWAHDSGILSDIPIEFGGQHRGLPEFKKDIEDRYPDAPEDLIELLKRKGIINISGDHVEIIK